MDAKVENVAVQVGSVKVKVNMKRHRKNLAKAQFDLDTAVMQDMTPYMPMQTGVFIQRTEIESMSIAGTGTVCAGASPQGRFLYEGKVMLGENSRSAYANLGEKKVVTQKPLTYANGRIPHWFAKAKEVNGQHWVKAAKKAMKGK